MLGKHDPDHIPLHTACERCLWTCPQQRFQSGCDRCHNGPVCRNADILANPHRSLGIFSLPSFGLILQSLHKPLLFDRLISNCAFILIASLFERRPRQAVT